LPNKVIILAGARNSGKTKTIQAMIDAHLTEKLQNIYVYKGKRICIYLSSAQERPGVGFCEWEKVLRVIDKAIRKSSRWSCGLMVIPFSIQNDRRHINTNCIVKPIEALKRDGWEIHLVYLQRDDVAFATEITALMLGLSSDPSLHFERIISRREYGDQLEELWKNQGEGLWKMIERVDP
jgi:predicted ABC-type ATPase